MVWKCFYFRLLLHGKYGISNSFMVAKKVIKIIKYLLLSLLLLFIASTVGGSFYMLDYSLASKHNNNDEAESYQYMYDNYPYLHQWVDSLNKVSALKDTFIIGNENNKLHAYFIAANKPTKKTAILQRLQSIDLTY